MVHLPKLSEGGSFTLPPAGTFPAIAYRLIDLGTQEVSFKGKSKEQRKVLLSFEIKDDEAVMEDGQPMTIHQRYTWSMHEKANLRKVLESWRGKKFTDDDFGEGGFDVRKLIKAPCMLTIIHNESDGKTYANIASISKLPKALKAGKLHNPTVFLWLERGVFDEEVFEKLSDGIKDTITDSPEYHELMRKGSGAEVAAARNKQADVDDEIPF